MGKDLDYSHSDCLPTHRYLRQPIVLGHSGTTIWISSVWIIPKNHHRNRNIELDHLAINQGKYHSDYLHNRLHQNHPLGWIRENRQADLLFHRYQYPPSKDHGLFTRLIVSEPILVSIFCLCRIVRKGSLFSNHHYQYHQDKDQDYFQMHCPQDHHCHYQSTEYHHSGNASSGSVTVTIRIHV